MKKLILIAVLASVANAYQSTVVVNDSKCDLHEVKYYTINDTNFVSKPSYIQSHKSAPITVNFKNAHAHEDEYLAGIAYKVACGGESSGEVAIEFSLDKIGITFSQNTKVKINKDESSISKLVFTDN